MFKPDKEISIRNQMRAVLYLPLGAEVSLWKCTNNFHRFPAIIPSNIHLGTCRFGHQYVLVSQIRLTKPLVNYVAHALRQVEAKVEG